MNKQQHSDLIAFPEVLPTGLRDVLEHVADVERALYKEIDSRISAEYNIHAQVHEKLRVALEKHTDTIENEIARMYRRVEADIVDRLSGFSREVNTLKSSVSKLNRQIELMTIQVQETREQMTRLESRCGWDISPEVGSRFQSPISTEGRNEISRLREVIESDLNNSKKLSDLDDYLHTKVMTRIETIEDWLKVNLTPEIVRLKEQIKAECSSREDSDKELMDIVRQYTDIMRRHFECTRKDIGEGLPGSQKEAEANFQSSRKDVGEGPRGNQKEAAAISQPTHPDVAGDDVSRPKGFRKSEGWQQLNNIFTS